MYDNGNGVTQDDEEAVKWYRLAADQGNARAQFTLGLMYSSGEGVPESKVAALALYNCAVANDSRLAGDVPDFLTSEVTAKEIKKSAKSLARKMAKPGNLLKALDQYVVTTESQL